MLSFFLVHKCLFVKYPKSLADVISIAFLQSHYGEYLDIAESGSRDCRMARGHFAEILTHFESTMSW